MLPEDKFVFLTFFQSVQQVCAAAHAGHTHRFCVRRADVLRMKICAKFELWFFVSSAVLKIPPERKAANRYRQFKTTDDEI